jgi:hypothetical protein
MNEARPGDLAAWALTFKGQGTARGPSGAAGLSAKATSVEGSTDVIGKGFRGGERRHNGFELSGPAKSRPDYRAELAGSAPASG